MSDEELNAAEAAIDDCNDLAREYYHFENPKLQPLPHWEKLHPPTFDSRKRRAWELACLAFRFFNPDAPDPEQVIHDYLEHTSAQPDPCEIAKATALDAA